MNDFKHICVWTGIIGNHKPKITLKSNSLRPYKLMHFQLIAKSKSTNKKGNVEKPGNSNIEDNNPPT